jgi:hypothetical protein
MDHRLIYLVYIIVVLFPFLNPIGLPMTISPYVADGFNFVDNIPAGSTILVSVDFRMMSWSEIGGGAITIMQQVMNMPINIVIISLIPEGPVINEKVLASVDMSGRTYGVDWVNVGYVPGRDATCVGLADDFKSIVKADVQGTPIDQIPIMADITGAESFYGILTFEDEGTPWPTYWQLVKGIPIVKTGQALMMAGWITFWDADILVGLAAGVRGYAEWESLLGIAGEPTKFMDAVNIAFFYLIAMMILSNVVYYRNKLSTKEA